MSVGVMKDYKLKVRNLRAYKLKVRNLRVCHAVQAMIQITRLQTKSKEFTRLSRGAGYDSDNKALAVKMTD